LVRVKGQLLPLRRLLPSQLDRSCTTFFFGVTTFKLSCMGNNICPKFLVFYIISE